MGNECEGPLIWYDSTAGMILHCASCGYIVTSGNFNDAAHSYTPILREGLVS